MIGYSVSEGVATVTIDRPDARNALNSRVVVITGAGDEAFSAGGDLGGDFVDRPLADHEGRGALADLFRAMWMCPKPIIARVNGVPATLTIRARSSSVSSRLSLWHNVRIE